MPLLFYRDPADSQYKPYMGSPPGRVILVISGSLTLAAAAMTDYVYICSAALITTLPTAVGNSSMYTIKRSGTGNVTVATTASQTIDGAANFVLDNQYMAVDIISDGTNWVIV